MNIRSIEQHPVQPLALGDGELALPAARLLAPVMDVAVAQVRQLQIDVLGVVGAAHQVGGGGLLTRHQGLLHGDVLLQQAQGTTPAIQVVGGEQGLKLGDLPLQGLAIIEHQSLLGLTDELVDPGLEGRHLLAIVGRERHHGAAERMAEQPLVDGDAAFLQQIQLVEHHHHGQPQLAQLQGEIEGALQVRGVDDVEQQIRLLALDEAAGDLLVDGDPAPVAHLLAGAGQGVEQGGLAAVGVADRDQVVAHTDVTSILLWARLCSRV